MKKADLLGLLVHYIVSTFMGWTLVSMQISAGRSNMLLYAMPVATFAFLGKSLWTWSKKLLQYRWKRVAYLVLISVSIALLAYFIGYLDMTLVMF